MTKFIRGMTNGRLRVWWLTHHADAKNAVFLVLLAVIYLTVSTMDYNDLIDAERSRAERAESDLMQERAARTLPSTVFVIEGATPAEVQRKLAGIAGDLDVQRMQLRGARP